MEQQEEDEKEDSDQDDQGAKAGKAGIRGGGSINTQLHGRDVRPSVAPSKQSFASSKFEPPKSES